jgi:hypothetical protein
MALYPRPHTFLLSPLHITNPSTPTISHSSDSDTDDSMSSTPRTPSTLASPSDQPSHTKPLYLEPQLAIPSRHHSRSRFVDALQSFQLPWNSKYNSTELHPSLQLPVRV